MTTNGTSQIHCGIGTVTIQRMVTLPTLIYWWRRKVLWLQSIDWHWCNNSHGGGVKIYASWKCTGRQESCAAIFIEEEPDFCVLFNHKREGFGCKVEVGHDQLHNVIPECAGSNKNRAVYEEELHLRINNGWLILTCLGFGLNVALLIMKAIVKVVLTQSKSTMKATSP